MNKIEPRQKKSSFKTIFEGYFEKQSLGGNEWILKQTYCRAYNKMMLTNCYSRAMSFRKLAS